MGTKKSQFAHFLLRKEKEEKKKKRGGNEKKSGAEKAEEKLSQLWGLKIEFSCLEEEFHLNTRNSMYLLAS